MHQLELSKRQEQVMSQKMILSASILQMESKELEAYIADLAMENPLIEMDESSKQPVNEKENRIYYKDDFKDKPEDWNITKEESLQDYVLSQLVYAVQTQKDQKSLSYLAACLGENGLLEIEETAACQELRIDHQTYEDYISILQTAEPAGIGARSLAECLLIQLHRKLPTPANQKTHQIAHRVLSECMSDLAKNQMKKIAQTLDVSVQEVYQAVEFIRTLNPKPGNGFFVRENLKYIQPDVIVVKFKQYFEVMLHESSYPDFAISPYYSDMLKENCDQEVKSYIEEKKAQAEWVKTCIAQRNQTLLAVTKEIIHKQHEFFEEKHGRLKPLRMIDVADAIHMHESTISRAVKYKYLQCTKGIFPLNYFFMKQVGMPDNVSAHIKEMIQEIIAEENKERPLSDQKIMEELCKREVQISRRTVAKYRNELGISDTNGRKVYGSN